MRWLDAAAPERMRRVALAPPGALRDVLVPVADTGAVEIEPASARSEAARRRGNRALAWEAQLEALRGRGGPAIGSRRRWPAGCRPASCPASRPPSRRSAARVVPLPSPAACQPPTLIAGPPLRRSLTPLVADLRHRALRRPRPDLAGLGQLRADVRHDVRRRRAGRCCCSARRVALRAGWPRLGAPVPARPGRSSPAPGWPRPCSASLYGEFFGPTGLVPVLWLDPLDQPVTLLLAAVGVGAVLLAGAYALGTVNRWREGGWPAALYAPSGIAGSRAVPRRRPGAGRRWYCASGRAAAGVGGLAAVAGLALAFAGSSPRPAAAAPGWSRRRWSCSTWCPAGLQRRVVHPAGRVRPDPRGAGPAGLGGHPGAVAPGRRSPGWPRSSGVRWPGPPGVQPGGAGRRRPGAAAGVLRAVLPGVRDPGPAIPAVARCRVGMTVPSRTLDAIAEHRGRSGA